MVRAAAWIFAGWAVGCSTIDTGGPRLTAVEYFFDRNALSRSVPAGDHLVAFTFSGNLLRFDTRSLKLTAEHVPPSPVVCLGRAGEGEALVGFEDGGVARVDVGRMRLRPERRLEGRPLWIDGRDGFMALTHVGKTGYRIHGASGEHAFKLDVAGTRPSAFHMDRSGRLWLGVDAGEWGGWLGFIDPRTGIPTPVFDKDDLVGGHGIYGFSEDEDGRLLAFGGLMHMGTVRTFILEADPRGARRLFHASGRWEGPQGRPSLPVTHVLPARPEGYWVFAYSEVFHADRLFRTWRKAFDLDLRLRSGRPDAMGSYPAMRTLHVLPEKIVGSTARDGLWCWRDGRPSVSPRPHELGAAWVSDLLASREGLLAVEGTWDQAAWRRSGPGWESFPVEPPIAPPDGRMWSETRLFAAPDGGLFAFVSDGWSDPRGALLRRDGHTWSLEAVSEPSVVDVHGIFATPDGVLWGTGQAGLHRYEAGRWRRAGPAPDRGLWCPRVRPTSSTSCLLLDQGSLYEFAFGTFRRIDLGDEVLDALEESPGVLLIAGKSGLRRVEKGQQPASAFSDLRGKVDCLGRDGLGRVWLGGEGLWVVEDGTPARVRTHPLLEAPQVNGLAADPERADGILIALGSRGILQVRRPGP